MTRVRRFVGAAVVFLAAWSTSRDATAAGFAAAHFGGEQGSVVATNPLALYYNPAGIGFSEGIHFYLDGEIALRSATWQTVAPAPGASDQANSQYGNTGKAALFNVFAGPALGMTVQVGDHLVFGGGLFVPFGGRVHFGSNSSVPTSAPDAYVPNPNGNGTTIPNPKFTQSCSSSTQPICPLAANGVQRWHIDTASLTFLYATVGAALRFGPLSIGAAGNFINSQISDTQSHTLNGDIDSTVENSASLNVQGNNGSFAGGVMLELVPKHLWLAGSYQAQPGLGPQTLKGTLNYNQGAPPYYPGTGSTNYNVDFHESLPDIIRAGIRADIGDVELRAFGDYTRWSLLTNQCINQSQYGPDCSVYPANSNPNTPLGSDMTPKQSVVTNIPRYWKNTYGVRLGASYFASPVVELFAGVGYETGAVPDATIEPGAMDANNFLGSLGGSFLIADGLHFAASYTQIQFENRDVTTSQLTTYSNPSLSQSGNGQYTQWIGVIDINAEKQF
jgi:long-chain fatty acid transport protein